MLQMLTKVKQTTKIQVIVRKNIKSSVDQTGLKYFQIKSTDQKQTRKINITHRFNDETG